MKYKKCKSWMFAYICKCWCVIQVMYISILETNTKHTFYVCICLYKFKHYVDTHL